MAKTIRNHATEPAYVVEGNGISKSYTISGKTTTILKNVDIRIRANEFVVIAGSSGCGKTTLLSILCGLDKPSNGRVIFENRDITKLPEDDLAPLRNRHIGFVFQSFHLVPALTAIENICLPAELAGDQNVRFRAEDLLNQVSLTGRKDNFPHQLSGGEKQRVAICRALINNPQVIFADEPTGNLDAKSGKEILDLLLRFKREFKMTVIVVSHSPEIAKRADRVLFLKAGQLSAPKKNGRKK